MKFIYKVIKNILTLSYQIKKYNVKFIYKYFFSFPLRYKKYFNIFSKFINIEKCVSIANRIKTSNTHIICLIFYNIEALIPQGLNVIKYKINVILIHLEIILY